MISSRYRIELYSTNDLQIEKNDFIYNELIELSEKTNNALYYSNCHGKEGTWTYDILREALETMHRFLNRTYNVNYFEEEY